LIFRYIKIALLALKSCDHCGRAGSSPALDTVTKACRNYLQVFSFYALSILFILK